MRNDDGSEPQATGRAAVLVWAALLAGAALAARLYDLAGKPLWLDEVLTRLRASLAVPVLIDDSIRNNHSPLFFLLEHVVATVSSGAFGLRLLPALAGALSAALVFATGRAAGLRAGAVLGGLFAGLAPLQVAFGQEARPYTPMLALILVALWGLVRLAADPDSAALARPRSKGFRAAWLAYALGTGSALLIHGDALLWWIVSNVAMLAAVLPRTALRRPFLLRWGIAQAFIIAVAAPVYVAILLKGRLVAGFLWIPPLTARFIWTDVASLYGLRAATMVTMRLLSGPIPYLAPSMIAIAVAGFIALRRQPGPRAVLVVAALGLPLLLAILSLKHQILLPRYLLWSAAPFFVIAGAAIENLPALTRPLALAAAAGLLVLNLTPYYRTETKPRWDLAADFLASRLRPNDVVFVVDSSAPLMLNAYFAQNAPPVARPTMTSELARARLAIANSGRIWAIYGPAGQAELPPESAFFGQAQALGTPGAKHKIGREITIEKIEPSDDTVHLSRD